MEEENQNEGIRMKKLREALIESMKRCFDKSLTEDQFVACYKGFSPQQQDLLRQIYAQFVLQINSSVEDEFNVICEQQGVRAGLNGLDKYISSLNAETDAEWSHGDPTEIVERACLTQRKLDLENLKKELEDAKAAKQQLLDDYLKIQKDQQYFISQIMAQIEAFKLVKF